MPIVAIVGRPNVGKSSLFNRLVGQPVSIVDPTAGVTRDRILHEVRRDGFRFDLVDTGGIGLSDEAKLQADVEAQVERAIDNADRILFVVDGREGMHPLDEQIAQRLRPINERVQLVVNKIDHDNYEPQIHEFLRLGLGSPVAVSAEQVTGLVTLLETLAEDLPNIIEPPNSTNEEGLQERGPIRIAFAGRRNVGKSSLTNALCGEERVIVADLAGTTRDAIDVPISSEHGDFILVDTAGLRRKNQMRGDLDFYSAVRTEAGVRRADIIALVVDCTDPVSIVDKKLAHFVLTAGKPTVVVVNKWDLAKGTATEQAPYADWLRGQLPGLEFAPILFTSAVNKRNITQILALARELWEEAHQRIPTAEVNKLLELAVQRRRPRKVGPQPTKILYGTQAGTVPPTFVIFVNRTDWIEPGYDRYLTNFLREHLPFQRVPLHIIWKSRESAVHDNDDRYSRKRAGTKAERAQRLILPQANPRQRDEQSGQRSKRRRK